MSKIMEYKGFKAQIMEADRLIGGYVHSLPPGVALDVYSSDEFVQWPENWCKKGAFIIPVRPDRGLWFNWTMNSDNNTAVIPTVKGCNPITGMQTSGFFMERYENKCPKHDCDFMHDRFCPKCNYKWPPQNYVGPKNMLWWDGFLNCKDGTVRQFFFSEEELRDVASALIGKENTVPAFGFAFYAPKERRSEPYGFNHNGKVILYQDFKNNPAWDLKLSGSSAGGNYGFSKHVYYNNTTFNNEMSLISDNNIVNNSSSSSSVCYDSYIPDGGEVKTSGGPIGTKGVFRSASNITPPLNSVRSLEIIKDEYAGRRTELKCAYNQQPGITREFRVKEVSIGAGAKIDQKLNIDPYELNSWKEIPDSVMTIYFVFQEKFEEIKAKGLRDIEGSKEGMLSNCVVG